MCPFADSLCRIVGERRQYEFNRGGARWVLTWSGGAGGASGDEGLVVVTTDVVAASYARLLFSTVILTVFNPTLSPLSLASS